MSTFPSKHLFILIFVPVSSKSRTSKNLKTYAVQFLLKSNPRASKLITIRKQLMFLLSKKLGKSNSRHNMSGFTLS